MKECISNAQTYAMEFVYLFLFLSFLLFFLKKKKKEKKSDFPY